LPFPQCDQIAGDKQSTGKTGKTAGEALDALTAQLKGSELGTLPTDYREFSS
jgi:hypothetical protein